MMNQPYGVYGYRFQDPPQLPIYQLFATGYQEVTETDYYWDGMKRIDGPLYLFQYTVTASVNSGSGMKRMISMQAMLSL